MATRGVFQLRKLTVKYCEYGGSSKGARGFIRHRIVEFANKTPAAEVVTELRPGHHPYIAGEYETGESKSIGVKNITPSEIMDYAMTLRNSSGRKVSSSSILSVYGAKGATYSVLYTRGVPEHSLPLTFSPRINSGAHEYVQCCSVLSCCVALPTQRHQYTWYTQYPSWFVLITEKYKSCGHRLRRNIAAVPLLRYKPTCWTTPDYKLATRSASSQTPKAKTHSQSKDVNARHSSYL